MRCLTLANSMREKGGVITFACTRESLRTVPELETGCQELIQLDKADDAGELRALRSQWDAAVIDHYALGAAYHRGLRDVAKAVLVIDDLADRLHDCDLLLDQTFGRQRADYEGLVPPHCKLLLGPRFALVRREFAAAKPATLARRRAGGPVRRILISMGLTDLGGVTAPVAKAALRAELDAKIEVTVGRSASSLPELAALARNDPRLRLHIDLPDICALMAACDVAIGAGGTTSWERCCLGLPTLMLVLSENQATVARSLAEAGAVRLATPGDPEALTDFLVSMAQDDPIRLAMVESAAAICDGGGAERVANELLRACWQRRLIRARRAVAQDAGNVWSWRNDLFARAASGTTDVIAWTDHCQWFASALADPTRAMYIVEMCGEAETLPIGVVRIEPSETEMRRVSISIDPLCRGMGMGGATLAAGLRSFEAEFGIQPMSAEIRPENIASRRIFEALGFHRLARAGDGDGSEELECFERPAQSLQATRQDQQP